MAPVNVGFWFRSNAYNVCCTFYFWSLNYVNIIQLNASFYSEKMFISFALCFKYFFLLDYKTATKAVITKVALSYMHHKRVMRVLPADATQAFSIFAFNTVFIKKSEG